MIAVRFQGKDALLPAKTQSDGEIVNNNDVRCQGMWNSKSSHFCLSANVKHEEFKKTKYNIQQKHDKRDKYDHSTTEALKYQSTCIFFWIASAMIEDDLTTRCDSLYTVQCTMCNCRPHNILYCIGRFTYYPKHIKYQIYKHEAWSSKMWQWIYALNICHASLLQS